MNLPQANILVERALAAYRSKSFEAAEELWAAAGELCAESKQWVGVAACHLNRGNALANLCRFAEAIIEFDRAQPIFTEFNSEVGVAGCRLSRGDALLNLGRFSEAIPEFDKAAAVFSQHEEWIYVALSHLSRGDA